MLTAIFFNEVGYFFYYTYQQYQVKKEVKRELHYAGADQFLEIMELDKIKQSIIWEEVDREFLLNGEMFDVKKTITKNGKTFLYCLNDKKEEALLKKFSTTAGQHGGKPGSNKTKHVLKLQENTYLLTSAGVCLQPLQAILQPFYFFDETPFSKPGDIITPPPRPEDFLL